MVNRNYPELTQKETKEWLERLKERADRERERELNGEWCSGVPISPWDIYRLIDGYKHPKDKK